MFKVTILTLFCSFLAGSDTGELGVKIERNVPVPMRDGTILRADVHRPDRGGPYPVLVHRTPYSKAGDYSQFVKAGYIVVDQDVRGRYRSEGEYESYRVVKIHDAYDGYDTVEWAAKLPGSNGKVGTFGYSDTGMRLWPLAALRPPSLKAMHANRCIARLTDVNQGTSRAFSIKSAMPPETRRRNNHPGVHTTWEAAKLWAEEKEKWTWWLPWSELPRDIFDDEIEEIEYLVENPNFDPLKLDGYCKDVVVPNLAIYGWFDLTGGDILLFQKMIKEAKSEVARRSTNLVIGPWSHGTFDRRIGNIDFGPRAGIDRAEMQIRWFDHWLRGSQNGVDKNALVRIFVMGDNQWRDEQSWPLARSKEKVFYMTSDGHANTPAGSGRLEEAATSRSGVDRYVYDPRDPVLSPSGPLSNFDLFPSDQRRLAQRQDILVYQTELLKVRTEVTGEPVVDLYVASSARDTDWIVRLIDVYPDGLAVDVSYGFLRARYRNGLDKPEFITPGEISKYVIRMRPTSNAFLPGHRIRLDITSSDFPSIDRNHNTAEDQYSDAALLTAYQAIHHGGEMATRISLPWVENPVKPAELVEEVKPETVEETKPEPAEEPAKKTYPLHQAATDGDTEKAKHLLSEDVDIDSLGEEGRLTPLCYAVTARQAEMARLLIEEGADVNKGLPPPLYTAVEVNDISIAEHLIARGAKVNPFNRWVIFKRTVFSSSVEMAKLFIDKGADMYLGPQTVWQIAIDKDRTDIMELLLQEGMDINTVAQDGTTPLSLSLAKSKKDMASLLLANDADISRKTKNSLTPWYNAAVEGQTWIAELLLDRGVNIDERDDVYEFTALHYAARFGQEEMAEFLIQKGADIAARDKWCYQPIHWAAYHDRPDIVELLIVKGADVNAKTSLGQTPLDLAIPRRNTKTIEVLNKHRNKNTTLDKPYVVLERGEVRAVIVNNEPVDDEVLPGHRGGYSGAASLTHRTRDKNLFVTFYAGLNFEHIHDGTNQPRDILFEPRQAPMQIRRIDEHTAELYQPPTPHWQLESWLRYQLLEDGVIEMTLECIPRARTFKNDYIGLFFASYINKPESLDINFPGCPAGKNGAEPRWIRGVTPEHGTLPTHLAVDDNREFAHDPNFPLTLVFNKSNYRYTEPWYYGVSGGMAFVLMFRPEDNVRFSQSPSGGGNGNPAWDFQWFVPQYKVGQRYRFVMRAMYLPFESQQQIIGATARHRAALEQQ